MAREFKLPKRLFDAHNHLFREDDDGSLTVEGQKAMGIETTVVMGLPCETRARTDRYNQRVVRAQKKFPGKIIAGVYVDPRDARRALKTIRDAHAAGVRLVKLFPNLGYYPDDAKMRPFFDEVEKLKMAVLSHCGWLWLWGGQMAKEDWATYFSAPGRFEKVARMHPETTFILAHMGGINGFLEAVMLATRTPNVYVDTSPGQGWWVLETMPRVAGTIPAGKLLWGADSHYTADGLKRVRKGVVGAGFGPQLEKVFYLNARGIYEKLGVLR